MSNRLDAALNAYLAILESNGSATPKVIRAAAAPLALQSLRDIDGVVIGDELAAYLMRVDGYDVGRCAELGLHEPQLAWGMFAMDIEDIRRTVDDNEGLVEDPDYWPHAFLPVLWDGSGSHVVVNCLAGSSTHGAVYDMSEGVGCNQIAPSLADFLEAAAREVSTGLRVVSGGHSTISVDGLAYLQKAAPLFGHSAYFRRSGRMGTQIVDWH